MVDANETSSPSKHAGSKPLFVGIAGGTASGKTTLVNQLVRNLSDVGVVSLCFDSYYREFSHLPFEERERINFDSPEAFDHSLFRAHLSELAAGREIQAPLYDYAEHCRRTETVRIAPSPVVLLDGFLLLHDEETRKFMTLTAFIDVDPEVRFQRRLLRDTKERGRTPESVVQWWHERVYPSHVQYCQPTCQFANFVLGDRETWPEFESAIRNAL